MTTLQKIITAAKKLKKQHPNKYSKWTDYVKAASKTVKTGTKKVGAVKKKTAAKKKPTVRSSHTDKGSHNVKIKVVSGVSGSTDSNKFYIKLLSEISKEIETKEAVKDIASKQYADPKNKALKSYWASKRNTAAKTIAALKKQQAAIKKLIK
jgi:hypothetical protein